MNRKLGAPSGAFFGVNGAQSAFESRTSSLMTPLNSLSDLGACALAVGAPACCEQAASPSTVKAGTKPNILFNISAFLSLSTCGFAAEADQRMYRIAIRTDRRASR